MLFRSDWLHTPESRLAMLGTCRDGGTIYKSYGSGRLLTQPKYDIIMGCSETRSCSQMELAQGVCGESVCDSRLVNGICRWIEERSYMIPWGSLEPRVRSLQQAKNARQPQISTKMRGIRDVSVDTQWWNARSDIAIIIGHPKYTTCSVSPKMGRVKWPKKCGR